MMNYDVEVGDIFIYKHIQLSFDKLNNYVIVSKLSENSYEAVVLWRNNKVTHTSLLKGKFAKEDYFRIR